MRETLHGAAGRVRARAQAGFSTLDALVAMAVVAFGMLAIASFQITLSRGSDIAKQRTEATRIAERDLDQLRSFGQRQADGTPGDARFTYVEDLVSTTAAQQFTSASTNTTFNLERTVTTPTGDRFRWVNVIVWWNDRSGQRQEVRMATAIADGDPADVGVLGVGRGVSTTLRPKNRNINIPYPAVTLAGGQTSAFMPPPGNVIFVFNNNTGNITRSCTATPFPIASASGNGTTVTVITTSNHPFSVGDRVTIAGVDPSSFNGTFNVTGASDATTFTYSVPTTFSTVTSGSGGTATKVIVLAEGVDLSTVSGLTCSSADAYIFSGYVRFKTQGAAASASNIDDPNELTDPTLPLLTTDLPAIQPITFDSAATGHAPSGYECYAQRQVTVRNNSSQLDLTIPEGDPIPAGYSDSGAPRFIAYTCVVTPINHDGNDETPKIWSGEVRINPSGWTIGTTSGTYRVCRFTSDYNRNGVLSNHEHPRYYRQVSGAVDNQNFLVVKGGDSCPTDVASDPAAGNYLDTNTAIHQPSASAELSFRCLTLACNGANRVQMETTPANPAAAIPME